MRISDWSSDVCSSDLIDLVETHALDNAGIVGSKEGIDLHARALAHLGQERVPLGLQILRGLGGDNAEIQFLGFGRLGCATQGQTSQRRCHKGFEIGRAACREGVCTYGEISVVAITSKKTEN